MALPDVDHTETAVVTGPLSAKLSTPARQL